MSVRRKKNYIHDGDYVAVVDVDLIEDETGWAPYLSLDDAYTLDDAQEALRNRDLAAAEKYGEVYHLERVEV